eukprot:CAMPEP_0116140556 /NCGR_PEP_ID=MMETSP0329-20121206/13915_1 /TAXON_ID=697910 /ORGANISM="Pseudo-nitzschia arenysensis, Strain B593" /LENGTH=1141 /DNA_ID=CAMNT_0003635687 /DNA_START=75 /DNA_END=3500 /DNA_ORIENTATION=+
MNEDDEETAKAFAAIQQTLHGFSSPNDGGYFGRQSQNINDPYKMDAMEWMQNELKGNEQEASMLPLKTPKRTPMMERAGTPIMSNSSSNRNLSGLSQTQTPSNPKTPGSASGRSTYSLDDNDNDSDRDSDEDMGYDQPMPVKTPIQRKFKTGSAPTPESTFKSQSIGRITSSQKSSSNNSIALKQSVFRRHHDALWEYLTAKRSLHKRLDLERQEKELEEASNNNNNNRQMTMMMMMDTGDNISKDLSRQECQMEVDFCASLCEIGHGLTSMLDDYTGSNREGPMEEGHFWDLLAKLRKLSLPALIWDDDQTSMTQNMSSQSFFLQQLASQTNVTPKELIEAMSSSGSLQSLPLVLERKQQLLKWIQTCLDLESRGIKAKLPSSSSNTNKVLSPSHPDDPNLPSLISEMDSNLLKNTTKVCLALFLEGKNSDALQVARSRGQFSKAAMWKGGEPYGYSTKIRDDTQTVEELTVGNPNRFLWKRQVWRAGRKLLIDHSSQQQQQQQQQYYTHSSLSSSALEEAAIYSILSDDVQNALDNPCIRSSWTRSLCVLLMGVQGRTQDEVLSKNNKHKRRNGACFAGYQYEEQENEQLRHTNQLGTMTEAKMVTKLSESHFLNKKDQQDAAQDGKMHKIDYKAAILAFVVGKSAILEYCATETARMHAEIEQARARSEAGEDNDDEYINQDWEGVRFLTHLTLFLDSLKDSSTPTVLDEMDDNKNAMLFQYVQYLESRPDLWHMIALYVCFLPDTIKLTYYPTVLARVLDDKERQNMTEQIRKLMPEMELPLLRQVVRLSLSAPATGGDDVDAIKCNSLQWLLHNDEHLEDALICANILLREFFLNEQEDKTGVAMTFLKDYLPENFLNLVTLHIDNREEAGGDNDDDDMEASDERATKVNNALTEHLAYIGYLQAYQTFQTWRDTLKATPTSSLDNHRLPSYNNLNETERAIADSNVMRSWIKEKKKQFEIVLETAEDARGAWHTVLTHPGGWLSVDDGDDEANAANAATTIAAQGDSEELERKVSIRTIRSRHLVLATNLYHQVCEETAAWLSKSLHEAQDLNMSRDEILHKLRSTVVVGTAAAAGLNNNDTSKNTPEYWYQHSLDLATLVASDKHGIYKAFPPSDLKELISKLGETAVSKLMNV